MVTVEVLFFDGCPNHEPTVQLVRDVVAALGVAAELREVTVESAEDAEALRFLGSPSVRVNGRDIEPGVIGARRAMPTSRCKGGEPPCLRSTVAASSAPQV